MSLLKRAAELCSRFAGRRILVYGDVILDRYIFGQVERISPEAPVPVLSVELDESRLGGAGNVAANIDRLGGRGLLLGVCGDDAFAAEVARLKGADDLALRDPQSRTIVKTRVVSQRQQIVRIDRDGRLRMEADVLARLGAAVDSARPDAVIVSDYAKGTVTAAAMDMLKGRAAGLGIPLIVDPKPAHAALYRGVTGLTPNLKEAAEMAGRPVRNDSDLAAVLNRIRRRTGSRFAVVTRGPLGISAAEAGRRPFHLPAYSREVFDVTGAGDTVVAVLTLALTAGASLREAVSLANAAASIVVEKVGTSQVTAAELLERMALIGKRR